MIGLKKRLFYFFPSRMKYIKDKKEYIKQFKKNSSFDFKYSRSDRFIKYYDCYDMAGDVDGHYFLQDLYVSKLIIQSGVYKHYDIGSRIDGFLTHLLASGIIVEMIDVRPFKYNIENLLFLEGDATNLSSIDDNSIESLSSLHAVEHFGLGRYGDNIDYYGWEKALKEFERVLKKNGVLYLSVPIGNENKLCFNAHRIFSPKTIVESFEHLSLERFVYIKDYQLINCDDYTKYNENKDYLCGIFVFKK